MTMHVHDPEAEAPAETQSGTGSKHWICNLQRILLFGEAWWEKYHDTLFTILINTGLVLIFLLKLLNGVLSFCEAIWGWTRGTRGWKITNLFCTRGDGRIYRHWWIIDLRCTKYYEHSFNYYAYFEATHEILFGLIVIWILWRNFREDANTFGKSWILIAWTLLPLIVAFGLSTIHIFDFVGLLRFRLYVEDVSRFCFVLLTREMLPRFDRLMSTRSDMTNRNIEILKSSYDIFMVNEQVLNQCDEASRMNEEVLERIANRGRRVPVLP